jgi:hypothetical protein
MHAAAGEKQFAQKVEIKICNVTNVFFKVRSPNLGAFSFQELLGGENAVVSPSNSYDFLSSWLSLSVSMCSVIINLSIYLKTVFFYSHACVLHFRHSNSFQSLSSVLEARIVYQDVASFLLWFKTR